MSAQVSPSPGNDRDDAGTRTPSPPAQDERAIQVSLVYDDDTQSISLITRRLAHNKAHGWNELPPTSEASIPYPKKSKRMSASEVLTRVMPPIRASAAVLVRLEIALPRPLLKPIQSALGDLSLPQLEALAIRDCLDSRVQKYPRLASDLLRNGAPRLSQVVLDNVGWPEAGLQACGAITSVTLVADFPLTDDLGFLLRDCTQLRTLDIAAPAIAAVLRGLPVLQDLKRVTATLDLDSLLTLSSVLPPGLEHFNIAEYGRAAAPSDALLLLMISLWTADRKTVSVYLARNMFAVRCEGTGVRVLQTADGSDFLSVDWLRGALPRNVTSLDMSLIDWSIIANALKDVELCALKQLTVRFARDPPFIPEDLPVHSRLTLRCPNLQMLVLQDFSLSWTLPLDNVTAFLRDCLCCETPSDVRICPRGATIISDTESRDFDSRTTPQMLSEIVANGGGAPVDEFEFWEDSERVLTHFAPQAYRYYRMGPHALTTAYEDD